MLESHVRARVGLTEEEVTRSRQWVPGEQTGTNSTFVNGSMQPHRLVWSRGLQEVLWASPSALLLTASLPFPSLSGLGCVASVLRPE